MNTVFLDLDGTLTDSGPGITRSMQYALEAMGHPVPPPEELLWCIGPPLHDNFRKLLGQDADIACAVTHYRARYATHGWNDSRVYDGVHEMLTGLRALGLDLHLVTSKNRDEAVRIVEHFELAPHLGQIHGSNEDGSLSDKTTLLTLALEATGAEASTSAMIGDRSYDMRGAVNTGIKPIGVLWGFGSADELERAGALHLAEAPTDLARLLGTIEEKP